MTAERLSVYPGGAAHDVRKVYADGDPRLNEWGLKGPWTVGKEQATLAQAGGSNRLPLPCSRPAPGARRPSGHARSLQDHDRRQAAGRFTRDGRRRQRSGSRHGTAVIPVGANATLAEHAFDIMFLWTLGSRRSRSHSARGRREMITSRRRSLHWTPVLRQRCWDSASSQAQPLRPSWRRRRLSSYPLRPPTWHQARSRPRWPCWPVAASGASKGCIST